MGNGKSGGRKSVVCHQLWEKIVGMELSRAEVMASRIHAQQLDRAEAPRAVTDAAIFDLGIQDSGRDGASWALANRGVPMPGPEVLASADELSLVWTLRGAPHFYRRADLLDVMVATSPLSESDAGKRMFDANRPLKAAEIGSREGLAEVATQMRRIVKVPMVKGDVSSKLNGLLSTPYLRECVPCGAIHVWELPFRLGALYGGLELQPGTSPPVLRRIPDWPRRRSVGPALEPGKAPEHLQPIRGYLRLLGPATPRDVAAFLDASVADIRANWPADAVAVAVGGQQRWVLAAPQPAWPNPELVRLLGPYDLLLQGKDRGLIVPDTAKHKGLWPTLGRPGAILSGTDIIGTWRPKASGKKFTVTLDLWGRTPKTVRERIDGQAARLADHRGLTFAGTQT